VLFIYKERPVVGVGEEVKVCNLEGRDDYGFAGVRQLFELLHRPVGSFGAYHSLHSVYCVFGVF
jgi:hypothetical protein